MKRHNKLKPLIKQACILKIQNGIALVLLLVLVLTNFK